MNVTVYPAYQRSYKSVDKLLQAWLDGYDFAISPVDSLRLHTGTYINRLDAVEYSAQYGIDEITLRSGSICVIVKAPSFERTE